MVSFLLYLGDSSPFNACNRIETGDEGVELSLKISAAALDTDWIPLKYYYPNLNHIIGYCSSATIRGYNTTRSALPNRTEVTEFICGGIMEGMIQGNEDVEFRWIQAASIIPSEDPRDVFSIDNLNITVYSEGSYTLVLSEEFENLTHEAYSRLINNTLP